jgi:hypothetical protein
VRLAREAARSTYTSSSGSVRGSVQNSPLASPILPASVPLPAPASFTALPDTIWLPFLDRPTEVGTLISTPPSARLFALLSQTLGSGSVPEVLPTGEDDASKWTYEQLECWLRTVDRDSADDHVWVHQIRACVLPRSELIWERLKGALGVPPELDAAPRTPRARLMLPEGSAIESDPEDDMLDELELEVSIEPLVVGEAPTTGMAPAESATGLGDIGEEDEDATEPVSGSSALPREEVVQGLRISTAPHPEDDLVGAAGAYYSPVLPAGTAQTGHSPSMLNLDATSSSTSIPGTASARRRRSSSSSSFGSIGGGYYDAVAERGPGNPLFPSSFAQLALAPTLTAK